MQSEPRDGYGTLGILVKDLTEEEASMKDIEKE